jgi:hypothetical protein
MRQRPDAGSKSLNVKPLKRFPLARLTHIDPVDVSITVEDGIRLTRCVELNPLVTCRISGIAQLAIPDVPATEDEVEVVAPIVHISMLCQSATRAGGPASRGSLGRSPSRGCTYKTTAAHKTTSAALTHTGHWTHRTINRQTCANTSDQPSALTLAKSHPLYRL